VSIAGIVLAAGAGSRMAGRPGAKLLLPHEGEPMAARVAGLALGVCDPVVGVVGCNGAAVAEAMRAAGLEAIVTNPDWAGGQSTSLRAGLAAVLAMSTELQGALVLLGDQPLLRPSTLQALIAAARAEPEAFVAPRFGGRRGNPVCIPAGWFDRAMGLHGDVGGRELLADPAARLVLVDVNDPGVLRDVDTRADYDALGD
jgi:molybdenum cofactor cytidylyltransferase